MPEPDKPTSSQRPPGLRPSWRSWLFPLLILAVIWGLPQLLAQDAGYPKISYTAFYEALQGDRVRSVRLEGQTVTGELTAQFEIEGRSMTRFKTTLPSQQDDELLPLMRKKKVKVLVENQDDAMTLRVLLLNVLPFVILIGLLVFISRRTQRMMGSGGPFAGILKGRTRRFEKEAQVNVTFEDVAGLSAAKRDLQEVVEFLKHPERFRKLGGKVPRGVLLVGPPGTGKTLLARAVAGESGVPFFSINGSEFIELFVGVGASRVREIFDEAKKVAPAIIFIDEIDAVGRSRGAGLGGGHDEREQTLNQLLSEMDGFSRNDLTIVLAATNRPDVLDPALQRPGRFDRRVLIDRPELEARKSILAVHLKGKPTASDVKLEELAANTPGFSGADLANLVNEAALHATRRGGEAVSAEDFRGAYDKIVLGDPRETKLDKEEKNRVAIHEAGHAVVAHYSPHAEPLHRISIIPRGMALGVTQQTPGRDKHMMTRPELEARLSVLMGGFAAEQLVLGETSSGAENDLKRASDIAFKMVAHYGMSERFGPVFHEHRTEHPFLGQVLATEGGTSDATVHAIEEEARGILKQAADRARSTIEEHRAGYDRLVSTLIERESIEKQDLVSLLGPTVSASGPGEGDALHYEK